MGNIETDRDQLVADYAAAMAAEPWLVMAQGCGASASSGFYQHAIELSQGVVVYIASSHKTTDGIEVLDDDQGVNPALPTFGDEITIDGGGTDGMPGTVLTVTLPPLHFPPHRRNNSGQSGGSGRTGGGGMLPPAVPWEPSPGCNPDYQDCDGPPNCSFPDQPLPPGIDCDNIIDLCQGLEAICSIPDALSEWGLDIPRKITYEFPPGSGTKFKFDPCKFLNKVCEYF